MSQNTRKPMNTARFDQQRDAVQDDTLPDRGPRPPSEQLPRPWRLLLQVGSENKTTLGIPIQERTLIGRKDSVHDEIDLDLTPYGGQQNGVSRRHAAITHEDGTLYIEDLGSTNGTRINGLALPSGRRYRLRDGDELEFGRVRIVVRFVRPTV